MMEKTISFTELTEDQVFLIGKLGDTIQTALGQFEFEDSDEDEERVDYGSVNISLPGPVFPGDYRVQVTMPEFVSDNLVVTSDSLDGALSMCIAAINKRYFG